MRVVLPKRLRVVRLFVDDAHPIRRVRRLTIALSVLGLWAIPLSGLLRIDLFGGEHLVLGRPVSLAVAVPVLALVLLGLYLFTFLVNWALGRVFCGFGCPVGALHRVADEAEIHGRSGALCGSAAVLAGGALALFAGPAALRSWWTPAILLLLSLALATYARRVRWRFCARWCPIGVYYTAIQIRPDPGVLPPGRFGVHFDPKVCTACDLCEASCPVGLDPRALSERCGHDPGGLALPGFPARSYCLSCGDCVRACARDVSRAGGERALELGLGRRD